MEAAPIIVTNHGDRRCRERLGLPRRAVQRTVERAWEHGAWLRGGAVRDVATDAIVKVWARHLFVFQDHGSEVRLVTVMEDKLVEELLAGVLADQERQSRLAARRELRRKRMAQSTKRARRRDWMRK